MSIETLTTLVYADVPEPETSNASSIASIAQQMSISLGVASAGMATAFFISSDAYSSSQEMIHGIHESLVALGAFTVLSIMIFARLEKSDGSNVSRQRPGHAE